MSGFNLLHPVFEAVLTCNKPQYDGYEVQNLLQNRSFMTEPFIKPPVDVVIKFPSNVEISKIFIDAKVGAQSSTSFEIYGTSNSSPENVSIFSLFGKGSRSSSDLYSFQNKRFILKEIYKQLHNTKEIECSKFSRQNNISEFELSHKPPCPIRNLSTLRIRITRVASGSTCCIKTLEIWGQPVGNGKNKGHSLIKNYYLLEKTKQPDYVGIPSTDSTVAPPPEDTQETTSVQCIIPEEYLDSITQELQVVPMLLPSGHSVDITTVDKFNQEEAKWGRPPSDPFTGKPYSKNCCPVPNTALKYRIDQFLLQNPQINITSQTLGSCVRIGRNITASASSSKLLSLKDSNCEAKFLGSKIKPTQNNKRPNITSDYDENLKKPSCKYIKTNYLQKYGDISRTIPPRFCPGGSVNSDETVFQGESGNHNTRLNSSLNLALSNALGNLPSFCKSSGSPVCKSSCIFCNVEKTTDQYKLHCKHFICRSCLLQKKSQPITCPKDNVISKQHDICKVHVTGIKF